MSAHAETFAFRRRCRLSVRLLSLILSCFFLARLNSYAVSSLPEPRSSALYAVSHLHPIVYFALFIVALLAIFNLILQGWIRLEWPVFAFLRRFLNLNRTEDGRINQEPHRRLSNEADAGIVGVRRAPAPRIRRVQTPLDGVNHPMPNFFSTSGAQTGAPRILNNTAKKVKQGDFKFSSAVDVPSSEELERRDKEQIVICGAVKGPYGKGVSSVIVYLTNENGARVGQSCRSAPESGEFRVLIHEPGRYALNGYKRGYIRESMEPLIVPIESGKIEGFNFVMIPEGCAIHGHIADESGAALTDVEVKCICGAENITRSGRTDESGAYGIMGVLVNSRCRLEVHDSNRNIIAVSDPFETVQTKEMRRDLVVNTSETPAVGPLKAQWAHEDHVVPPMNQASIMEAGPPPEPAAGTSAS